MKRRLRDASRRGAKSSSKPTFGFDRVNRIVRGPEMVVAKTRGGRSGHHDAERKEAHAEATTKGHMSTRHGGANASSGEDGHCVEGKRTPDNAMVSTLGKGRIVSTSSSDSDEEAMTVKRAKNWSGDAVALGYEVGTIKYSAYVLLAESGTRGMTVASIVGTAQRLSMYSWGQCKTPNNSVTAALSQDETFVRIAPSTYCLRSQLRGSGENLPVPRTSSGSHDSGTTGMGAHGGRHQNDSGCQSGPGQGRQHKKQRAHPPRPQSPMPFVVDETPYTYDDDEEDFKSVNIHVDDSYDRLNRVGEVKRTADALAQESYRRRMDVYGQVGDDFGTSFHFPTPEIVRPDHSPDPAVAGSCLLYYPTANARKQDKEGIPKSPEEPTEATHRAASWKDEARRLHYSRSKSKSSTAVTLPTWVLEQYMEEHNQILCGDL